MIPKIIHHVWPGSDEFKKKFHSFRQSWINHHPDWTFYFWRTTNLPEGINPRAKDILLSPDYSFTPKSDVLRFEVLRIYGGIYVDTDMECLKPFNEFLTHNFFTGFEDDLRRVCPSLIGCVPGHPIMNEMCEISISNAKQFGPELSNARPHVITSVKPFTKLMQKYLNDLNFAQKNLSSNGIKIYTREYFYPIYFKEKPRLVEDTPNAYAKHHWSGTDEDGWTKGPKFDPSSKDIS